MFLPVTSLTAVAMTFLLMALSMQVIRRRRTAQVAVGHGEDQQLLRLMRVQANFSEYVPVALILLFLSEVQQVSAWLLAPLAVLLLASRMLHAYGVSQEHERLRHRVRAMKGTATVLILLSALLVLKTVGLV